MEVLVALAIISMVSVMLGTMSTSTLKTFQRGNARIEAGSNTVRVQRQIFDLLGSARFVSEESSDINSARRQKVEWLGRESGLAPQPGLYRYVLEILPPAANPKSAGYSISLRWRQMANGVNRGSRLLASGLPPITLVRNRNQTSSASNGSRTTTGIWFRGCVQDRASTSTCHWPDLYVPVRFAT